MYIQEIVVDGFKSYASRTVIGHFDPEFNAITGLNGSGKSNILDGTWAACRAAARTRVHAVVVAALPRSCTLPPPYRCPSFLQPSALCWASPTCRKCAHQTCPSWCTSRARVVSRRPPCPSCSTTRTRRQAPSDMSTAKPLPCPGRYVVRALPHTAQCRKPAAMCGRIVGARVMHACNAGWCRS
ncbi:hypothetical protein EON66_10320 [archaeon]|nr:MAG: hypothetical protein EON66_10320 [archaeon]